MKQTKEFSAPAGIGESFQEYVARQAFESRFEHKKDDTFFKTIRSSKTRDTNQAKDLVDNMVREVSKVQSLYRALWSAWYIVPQWFTDTTKEQWQNRTWPGGKGNSSEEMAYEA